MRRIRGELKILLEWRCARGLRNGLLRLIGGLGWFESSSTVEVVRSSIPEIRGGTW